MTKNYRIASRKRGTTKWETSNVPMTGNNARSVVKQLNLVYPEIEHKVVKVTP